MTTVLLVLLCLAIAGRELYLATERKRTSPAPELAELRRRLSGTAGDVAELRREHGARLDELAGAAGADGAAPDGARDAAVAELDARIGSLVAQINDRVVPQVNDGLAAQRESIDLLAGEVAAVREQLAGRLDQAVAASLGADPVDTVAGALAAGDAGARAELARSYERLAGLHGLHTEMALPVDGGASGWRLRYYLSGRSPRALERDFIDLLRVLREGGAVEPEARALLDCLDAIERGGAQIGPLVVVRTPAGLACGVLTLAELRRKDTAELLADPDGTAAALGRLPESRFYAAR
ncbi:hypothetical protein [Actinomadura parmotrematis]|uniref:Uncharacterized protein n=1 Tax=Actinomadura parmotrematis TaxID=2864039 RepID=A0ABS7FRK3_9ACTN|nr:hypothetical protein [Actinomadura parmotrematis]MBW8483032.1 hypothetical protein [Actinomadura parmotrematis]